LVAHGNTFNGFGGPIRHEYLDAFAQALATHCDGVHTQMIVALFTVR
jgi:hypothetical protein